MAAVLQARAEPEPLAPAPVPAPRAASPCPATGLPQATGLLRELNARLQAGLARQEFAAALQSASGPALCQLTARGVPAPVALELAARARTGRRPDETWGAALWRELQRWLQPTASLGIRPGSPRTVALVGPTGAGKTTTLAKLAAQYGIGRNLRVGLVAADSFRVGAGEQLRSYARIMAVPLREANTPTEAAAAVAALGECDLILIDTPGSGFREPGALAPLQQILDAVCPDETHLVLPLNSAEAQLLATLNAYAAAGPNRLIFTKLDESALPGVIAAVRGRVQWPIAYVTTGQSVPADILPAAQCEFSRILLGA